MNVHFENKTIEAEYIQMFFVILALAFKQYNKCVCKGEYEKQQTSGNQFLYCMLHPIIIQIENP